MPNSPISALPEKTSLDDADEFAIVDSVVAATKRITAVNVTTDILGQISLLPDGTTATTQSSSDNSTKVATTAYVDSAVTGEDLWDRVGGGTPYLLPATATDEIGVSGTRIAKTWINAIDATTTVSGSLSTDSIQEKTTDNGVAIEGLAFQNDYLSKTGSASQGLTFDGSDNATFSGTLEVGGNIKSTVAATDGELSIENASSVETVKLNTNGLSFLRGGNLEVSGNIIQNVDTTDVSNPPTDAELDAAFGTPATVGTGFTTYIDDNGAGANFYQCVSDGTNWWTFTATKAV